jgi:nucleotide-binding universal stress UspA family protein
MFPFKKVLVPTDFSEASLCGLKMANELAKHGDIEIIVINVHKPIPHLPTPRLQASEVTFDITEYEKHVIEDAKQNLADVSAKVLDEGVNARLEVRMGTPAQEILKAAIEEEVDAILIATHGHTGLKHIVFGSVAQRVVRRANCPVVTIPNCEL